MPSYSESSLRGSSRSNEETNFKGATFIGANTEGMIAETNVKLPEGGETSKGIISRILGLFKKSPPTPVDLEFNKAPLKTEEEIVPEVQNNEETARGEVLPHNEIEPTLDSSVEPKQDTEIELEQNQVQEDALIEQSQHVDNQEKRVNEQQTTRGF
jgi:hypothetical protein